MMMYKPASVKMDVRMTCCLSVTRRRHRSGIGCCNVQRFTYVRDGHKDSMRWTHQYEYQSIQDHVRDAFTDKECVEIDTVPVFGWILYVPLIMKWTTNGCISLVANNFGRVRARSTYHWNKIVTSIEIPYPSERAAITHKMFRNWRKGKMR